MDDQSNLDNVILKVLRVCLSCSSLFSHILRVWWIWYMMWEQPWQWWQLHGKRRHVTVRGEETQTSETRDADQKWMCEEVDKAGRGNKKEEESSDEWEKEEGKRAVQMKTGCCLFNEAASKMISLSQKLDIWERVWRNTVSWHPSSCPSSSSSAVSACSSALFFSFPSALRLLLLPDLCLVSSSLI